jgi:hypothetical protein
LAVQPLAAGLAATEAAEAGDLVELFPAIGAPHLDPVFLDEKRHKVAAITLAVALAEQL